MRWRRARAGAARRPTTTAERVAEIGKGARGFVYTVSLTGTTGERDDLPPELGETVARVREATDVPWPSASASRPPSMRARSRGSPTA